MEQWMTDLAKELVGVMQYAQRAETHYHTDEDVAGFALIIEKHYRAPRHTPEQPVMVGIDLDGILRNCMEGLKMAFLAAYPQYTEEDIGPIVEWRFHQAYPIGKAIYDFMWESHAWEALYQYAPAYPNGKRMLRYLAEHVSSAHLSLVTSQPTVQARGATLAWIEVHGIHECVDDVILLGKGHIGKGHLGLDILLDDGTHNLMDCLDTPTVPICKDRSWNQDWKGIRVRAYADFTEAVKAWPWDKSSSGWGSFSPSACLPTT